VQYSISIGLGIAATVEAHVNNGGKDIVRGYRGALWLGVGFAAIAFFIVVFFVRDSRFDKKDNEKDAASSTDGAYETPADKANA
jgi:phosphotransferase system  glucose/maltose/N-acetylglucosamine-specific IIC component